MVVGPIRKKAHNYDTIFVPDAPTRESVGCVLKDLQIKPERKITIL